MNVPSDIAEIVNPDEQFGLSFSFKPEVMKRD
jgi:hypothetical protein